jgi:hypothetical protein
MVKQVTSLGCKHSLSFASKTFQHIKMSAAAGQVIAGMTVRKALGNYI